MNQEHDIQSTLLKYGRFSKMMNILGEPCKC